MAAKLLHSLADDNPDLQKQIGCMTGILQIFDRQHIGQNHRRLLPPPPGNSQFSNANFDADSSNPYRRKTVERISNNKCTNDRRLSTESSRASFSSSSRSSSFSSLDCGRLGHPDPSSLDRIIFPDTPSIDPVITQPSPKMGRLSLDLRDVVKDSMHRETNGVSVQQHGVKLLKYHNGSLDSNKALAKLKDAPNYYYSENQLPSYESKDKSLRDARRYSYDGREMNRLPSEPQDLFRTNQRINDLPRLSLDSKESSMRSASFDIHNEELSVTKQLSRPPSVVAKLMGLDTLPDNKSYKDGQRGSTISFEENRHNSLPLKTSEVCRPIRLPVSPRSSRKEPTSPRWRNAEMRPISSSKCSNEPAPWKHLEGSRSSQQQASRRQQSPENTSKASSPSVYSEIEKRLKDIEFKQSGKDLRALKQILEAMQAKGFIGNQREEEQSYTGSSMKSNSGGSAHRRTSSKSYESPIVIMKPAKLVQRSGIPASSLIPIDGLPENKLESVNRRPSRDQSSRSPNDRKANSRSLRESQNTTRTQRGLSDNNNSTHSSSKNISSTSPRLQKKMDFDKRSRPPTPPDSGRSRRQSNRQSTESGTGGSPGGRRRPKANAVQKNSYQVSEISSLSDDVSTQSSQSVVTLEPRCIEVTEHQNSPLEYLKYPDSGEIKTSLSARSSDDELVEERAVIAPEHTSPISVLDDSAYIEISPPPVKQTSNDHQGIEIKTIEQDNSNGKWNISEDLDGSRLSTEINRDKLQSIDNLIQKLQQLNTNHDEERTDYIASLCENSNSNSNSNSNPNPNPNPDHRYVSEILLASGLLLRDLTSGLSTFQIHPSGYPINPELFLVLEQTKSNNFCNPNDKLHRKLVFDSVNEILSRKLALLHQSDEPWLKPNKLSKNTLNAQKLLADLCDELEQLSKTGKQDSSSEEEEDPLKAILWEDVMHRSESWTDLNGDISGIVLDVERSIFKELVNEVVIGEAASCRGKPSRRRRQLFSK